MEKLLKKYRRDLHQIPEIGFNEFKTQKYLKQALEEMGYSPKNIAGTGLYVFINKNSDETYAFRSDMDALPIEEKTNLEYSSKHKGYMHACGHDGHMSALLTFAHYLKENENLLRNNILLIFQPAEEGPGGAEKIIKEGLLTKYNVKAIFGIHLYPNLEEGTIGSKAGAFMAQASEFNIHIKAKSAHAATPHLGSDGIVIVAKIINDIQLIISRLMPPEENNIITIGKIYGGERRNILAENVTLEGTIRTTNKDSFQRIIDQIEKIIKGIEYIYNVKITLELPLGYPLTYNDPMLYLQFTEALYEYNLNLKEFENPVMIAEDFSYYQQEIPGVFFFVGTKNKELGYTHQLHNNKFNFNESALITGMEAYIAILKYFRCISEE